MKTYVNLLNEIGMLSNTPRSGFAFVGSGTQSVAEHSYHVTVIGFVLADLVDEPVDRQKLMSLCLFHDLLEARTGDLNYVHKKYVTKDDKKALQDFLKEKAPVRQKIGCFIEEYEDCKSLEARLAHDADQLELLLILKQEFDTGNGRAMEWFSAVADRLSTEAAKKLAEQIRTTSFDAWWLEEFNR